MVSGPQLNVLDNILHAVPGEATAVGPGATPPASQGLTLQGLKFQVGDRRLLDDVSLTVTPGARHLILGPNGAGKSLLLRLMHGLIAPTGGKLSWTDEFSRARQAMVFQRPVMLRRSARENIVFALRVAKVQGDLMRLATEALERVGLGELADRPARLCSIGEQQRIALARAWAVSPALLFLDEPSASLDPGSTRQVEAIINAMHAHGTTIVMASHDLGQARRLADHVFFLHQGRLIEDNAAPQFFEQPESLMARAFLNGELLWEPQ